LASLVACEGDVDEQSGIEDLAERGFEGSAVPTLAPVSESARALRVDRALALSELEAGADLDAEILKLIDEAADYSMAVVIIAVALWARRELLPRSE
jgi:hypothetical protein